ncbi:MAG: DUF4440 domain-containing protein [Thermoanaerobaculia bacterium]
MRASLLVLALFATTASAQILDTEVWVGSLDMTQGKFVVGDLKNISNHPGYDNQPSFFPDGNALLFTTEAESLEDSGAGVHAVHYDLRTGTATPIPSARGFSPTPFANGKQLTVLRQGRVFLHELDGREVGALTETSEAGYYTRFDDRTWALFMNDKERRIVLYDARTKALETMDKLAITAPYRVPNARAVTYVIAMDDGKKELRRLDLAQKKVTVLAPIPFPTGGHHVWTSRGTLLMASGPTIHEWDPKQPGVWKPIYRAESPDLQGITRIAISPAGDRVALVSTANDETVIRDTRAASNRALAQRNAARVAAMLRKDASVTSASGAQLAGREAVEKALTEQFAQHPDLVYVRTPQTIIVSHSDAAASERGTWTGRFTSEGRVVERSGEYMAVWRKEITDSGTPSWAIAAEVFVELARN